MPQQVIFTNAVATTLAAELDRLQPNRVFVLTDENTVGYVWPELAGQLPQAAVITIPAGDDNKNLATLSRVWQSLQNNGATRKSVLVNLGGGMVTDLGGFAAATFKRGMRFINVPTSLLGAVDAAVGGKTGINFNDLKNDEIVFSNPIYQKIREEAEACFARSETHLARYFTSHPDPEISDIALNCISDKYELSKVHTKYQHIASEEERIGELVPRALFELKDAIIGQEIAAMQQQLKRGEESIEEKRALMQKLSDLFKVKAALAKELGERIVRPR